jgi:hypothetical protein
VLAGTLVYLVFLPPLLGGQHCLLCLFESVIDFAVDWEGGCLAQVVVR